MKKLSLVLMLVVFACGFAIAQRAISGTITDVGGEPLIGASILVKGTTSGTLTDIDGKYTLSVPDGSNTLVVSYTGFSTQEVAVGASTLIDISMSESAEVLNEVVVTGLGIRKEKKALGYGVTTLGAADIASRAEADIGRLLRGKATGVNIAQTSGIAGSGTNIIIRGYSSITGTNQPLFVVDGVPFNSSTNNDRNFVTGGATASSRFLDLDPNNIAEISILKGLSATVLYGEAGRNGVILVTTKSGDAGSNLTKKSEISVSQSVFSTQVANLPDYQNSFGNGFSGDYGEFFSNWGPAFTTRGSNGISAEGTVTHPLDQAQYHDDFPEFIGAHYDYKAYPSVEQFFETGVGYNTSVSLDKALGESGAISATYSHFRDEGFTPDLFEGDEFPSRLFPDKSNALARNNFSLGGNYNLGNGFKIRSSFNYTDTRRVNPPASVGFGSNPSGASLFANLIYTPRSVDLYGLPYQSPIDGSMVYYRRGSAIQNPLWTLHNSRDEERVRRFFGSFDVSYEIAPWLTANYRIGIDQYAQNNMRLINKGGSQVPDGQMSTTNRLNRITDHVVNLAYNFQFSDVLSLDGILGGNFRRETAEFNAVYSSNQFVFDLFNQGNFIDHQGDSFIGEENTIGAYLTATLGIGSFLYINAQARNDWTSTLEPENRSVLYPSASVSFVPTEMFSSLQNNRIINYLKMRVGYGTSAGYPNPYNTRSVLSTGTNAFVTRGGTILNTNSVSNELGNPNLKPELHRELELGVEARFLDNRLGIDLSWYNKQSTDLLIDLPLDPSTGYTSTTVNAAEVENKGIELGLNIIPVRGKFTWDMVVNYTRNRNIVNSIAEGIDQFVFSGYNTLGNFAIPGQPYGVIQGTAYERVNGKILVNASGDPVAQNDISVIGNPNPNYNVSWINTFSFGGFSLGFQWDYTDGGDVISLYTATLLARGVTTDTDVDRFLPVIFDGVKADGSPNDIQTYLGDLAFNGYFFADEGTLFDATVIRLREVSLTYNLPAKWLDNSPFGNIGIRLFGENLFYNAPNFPKGTNYDPEVLSLGVGNGRGIELITGPTARRMGMVINVTF